MYEKTCHNPAYNDHAIGIAHIFPPFHGAQKTEHRSIPLSLPVSNSSFRTVFLLFVLKTPPKSIYFLCVRVSESKYTIWGLLKNWWLHSGEPVFIKPIRTVFTDPRPNRSLPILRCSQAAATATAPMPFRIYDHLPCMLFSIGTAHCDLLLSALSAFMPYRMHARCTLQNSNMFSPSVFRCSAFSLQNGWWWWWCRWDRARHRAPWGGKAGDINKFYYVILYSKRVQCTMCLNWWTIIGLQ